MATLLDFGVAASRRNYDVTSRASNDVEFSKNFNKRIFSPKCTILPSYSKIEAGRFFLAHSIVNDILSFFMFNDKLKFMPVTV